MALTGANRDVDAAPKPPAGAVRRPGWRERLLSHRPAAYRTLWTWLAAGVVRDWRGAFAGLFAGWFGAPMMIAVAVYSAASLGLLGYLGGEFLLGDALADVPVWGEVLDNVMLHLGGGIGSIIGIVAGLLLGAVFGLLWPWFDLYTDDPLTALLVAVLQVVAAIITGGLYLIGAAALERWRLRLTGARRMSRREEELLLPLLHECARRLALENVPRVLIDDSREVNALAYTRHIVVTRGLLDEFDYDEEVLAGILSHELVHWRNADPVARLFVRGLSLPLYLPYRAADWVLRTFRNSILRFLAGLFAWPFAAAVRFVVMPMQAASSRAAEYRADQGAVLADQRKGLRKALERFRRSFDGSRNGWDAAVCATHPPNELRLEAVEAPGRRYPLPASRRAARQAAQLAAQPTAPATADIPRQLEPTVSDRGETEASR